MEACEVHLGEDEVAPNGLFPHHVVREGQERFLEDARMCMAQRTHLVAHAPTGLGKTAVALTASVETALEIGGTVLFLTSRQSQHAVAVETARAIWKKKHIGVVDLISKQDMCLALHEGPRPPCVEGKRCFFSQENPSRPDLLLEYPLHAQEAMRLCLRAGCCPHREAMRAGAEATVIVGDYNQMFCRGPGLIDRLGLEADHTIMVVDEAHNLPARLMESGSGILTPGTLQVARQQPCLKHFAEDLDVLASALSNLSKRRGEKVFQDDLDVPLRKACGVDTSGLAEEIDSASAGAELGGLLEFLYAWSTPTEAMVRYIEGDPPRLVASLIDPSVLASPVLAKVRSALLMSGTLHPPEMFADILGIEGAICRRYPSPFDPENRLVVATGGVTSRFRMRTKTMYELVAREIARYASPIPGNVAAFFPSYDFMSKVEPLLDATSMKRRILVERREHGKNEGDALLCQLQEGRSLLMGAISGSLSEGVDFRDNLLSGVIVVGLPLAPPSREMEATLDRMHRRFGPRKADLYVRTYPAISKVLQAAGRAIRGERDRAAIILMDDRYLMGSVRASFPEDFEIERPDDTASTIAEFFTQPVDGTMNN